LKVSIKYRLEYALVRFAMFALRYLPESLAYGGMSMLGQLSFLCSRRRQGYALKFLRQAYPDQKTDKELLVLARRATGNFLKVSMDMLRVHRVLREGSLPRHVEDLDSIRESMPSGPALVVSGHLGSWEVGAISVAHAHDEAHVVARAFKNPLLQDFLENSRRAAGLHVHSRRGGIRGLARALKNGAVGIQAVDQNQRLRGVFVPFFGKIASTERAAATLALRKGYPVVVAFCPRVGRGFKFRFEVAKVIHPPRAANSGDISEGVKQLVLEINKVLESGIRRFPEQYLWIHDRYRTQPDSQIVEDRQPEELPALEVDPEAV